MKPRGEDQAAAQIRDDGKVFYCLSATAVYCTTFGVYRMIQALDTNDYASPVSLIGFGFLLTGIGLLFRLIRQFQISVFIGFVVEVIAVLALVVSAFDLPDKYRILAPSGLVALGAPLSFLLAGISIQFLGYRRLISMRSSFVVMCGSAVFGYGAINMANSMAGIGTASLLQCVGFTGIGLYLMLAAWHDPTRSSKGIGFSAAVALGGLTANIVLWQGLMQTGVNGASRQDVANAVLYAGMLAVACLTAAAHFAQKAHARAISMTRLNKELLEAYDATLTGWAHALSLRDTETQDHTIRVTTLCVKLARKFKLPEAEILHIKRGSLLHDIGKIGIPDSILLKPGPLDKDEWEIMRRHPTYAFELLNAIKYLRPALDIPRYHHEKWDGSGYPHSLAGEAIPFAARMFAVIDVYDALSSRRPYRDPMAADKIIELIKSESGTHFEPRVVQAFLELVKSESRGTAA